MFSRPFGLRALWAVSLLVASVPSWAAHLVGGDLTYTCTGNNQYQLKLVVYRDCNSTGAQLDQTASMTGASNMPWRPISTGTGCALRRRSM